MYIKYDEYELLELFENEPVSVFDDEAGVFIYSRNDNLGFKLVMTMSIYEFECNISLNHDSYQKPIFEFKLKDVDSIKCDADKMLFIRKESEQSVIIHFKPNYSVDITNI
ncbi:hypothetical protein [Clostridium sp.]|uniref:hypothetical protein n=1 Tax=Clostridium sp. TaxID=1506 RepID=UPI00263359B6|nr:hypothetical protein [Clostridium sp.]